MTEFIRNVEIEEASKRLYDQWQLVPGWVPWVENGNSRNQDAARELVMSWMQREEKVNQFGKSESRISYAPDIPA